MMGGKKRFPGSRRWNTSGTYFYPMSRETPVLKMTHHATEGDSLTGAASWMSRPGHKGFYTLLIDPKTGESIQFCDADRAARGMAPGWNPGTNRSGQINIQVGWVGWSKNNPMRLAEETGVLEKVLKWADGWGIRRVMPSGPFETNNHNLNDWKTKSGHYAHGLQAPYNSGSDPGRAPDALLKPSKTKGCCDMSHEYGQLSGPDKLVIKPGTSVWVAWPNQEKKGFHGKSSARLKLKGPATISFEHKANGALTVSMVLINTKTGKPTGGGDHQDHEAGRHLTTNLMKVKDGQVVAVRLSNEGRVDVTASKMQVRCQWCSG